MRLLYLGIYIIYIILLSGCIGSQASSRSHVSDSCSSAPTIWWGRAGDNISDLQEVKELTRCYDWVIKIRD